MHKLSDTITRKFTEVIDLDDEWAIETDTGWQDLADVKQTVKYQVYKLELANGLYLECADNHIVFDENMQEVFVKDLLPGQLVQTKEGAVGVTLVEVQDRWEPMYDVGVNSQDHRFYSNGILSHNSTCAAAYLIWFAMFVPDSTILIAAHKHTGAQEIMQRIRYMYENLPNYLRAGATSYNKGSLEFDNGSRIISATTTENTGRGMSLTCVSSKNTNVTVRDKATGEIKTLPICELIEENKARDK